MKKSSWYPSDEAARDVSLEAAVTIGAEAQYAEPGGSLVPGFPSECATRVEVGSKSNRYLSA